MNQEVRTFATLDHCPQCGGLFVDAGEGVIALGHRHDLTALVREGVASMVGVSAIECPSQHGKMTVYRVKVGSDAVEVDFCATCAGVFFDVGEAETFGALANHAGEVVTHTGQRFSAPPSAAAAQAEQELRRERGGNPFSFFFEDLVTHVVAARARRRRTF